MIPQNIWRGVTEEDFKGLGFISRKLIINGSLKRFAFPRLIFHITLPLKTEHGEFLYLILRFHFFYKQNEGCQFIFKFRLESIYAGS